MHVLSILCSPTAQITCAAKIHCSYEQSQRLKGVKTLLNTYRKYMFRDGYCKSNKNTFFVKIRNLHLY